MVVAMFPQQGSTYRITVKRMTVSLRISICVKGKGKAWLGTSMGELLESCPPF